MCAVNESVDFVCKKTAYALRRTIISSKLRTATLSRPTMRHAILQKLLTTLSRQLHKVSTAE